MRWGSSLLPLLLTPRPCSISPKIIIVRAAHGGNQVLSFQAYGDDLAEELHDIISLIIAVGIINDATPWVGADLILVDHPFQRAPVTETVSKNGFWYTGEGEEVVVNDLGLVLA